MSSQDTVIFNADAFSNLPSFSQHDNDDDDDDTVSTISTVGGDSESDTDDEIEIIKVVPPKNNGWSNILKMKNNANSFSKKVKAPPPPPKTSTRVAGHYRNGNWVEGHERRLSGGKPAVIKKKKNVKKKVGKKMEDKIVYLTKQQLAGMTKEEKENYEVAVSIFHEQRSKLSRGDTSDLYYK